MCKQIYYLVYNVYNNTHRLHLFYVWDTTILLVCNVKTTYIDYVCFMYEHTTILPRVQRVKQHTSSTSVICMIYHYITLCTTCRTRHIVYICFMYEHTTILPRVQRVQQHTSSTFVLCISIQLYYLVNNVWSNTDRLPLFYICEYDYITLCTTCRTTHIVYICFIYEIQLDYLVYNG